MAIHGRIPVVSRVLPRINATVHDRNKCAVASGRDSDAPADSGELLDDLYTYPTITPARRYSGEYRFSLFCVETPGYVNRNLPSPTGSFLFGESEMKPVPEQSLKGLPSASSHSFETRRKHTVHIVFLGRYRKAIIVVDIHSRNISRRRNQPEMRMSLQK